MTKADPIKDKIEQLVLQVDEVIEQIPQEDGTVEALRELRTELIGMVNPEAKRWGIWEYEQIPAGGHIKDYMHKVSLPDVGRIDSEDKELGLEVTFYMGQMDGKPVIQIDGSGDFRVNVNDGPIWDQSTETSWKGPQ